MKILKIIILNLISFKNVLKIQKLTENKIHCTFQHKILSAGEKETQ